MADDPNTPKNDDNKRYDEDDFDFELDDVPAPSSGEDVENAAVTQPFEQDAAYITPTEPDDIDNAIFPPKREAQSSENEPVILPTSESEPEFDKAAYLQGVNVPNAPSAKIKDYLKSRELWVTLGVVTIVGFGILFLFFNILLPGITRQSEVISVPRVVNMDIDAATVKLEEAGLKVQVDSQYQPEMPPRTVLLQEPKQLARVKEGRRVYLIVNKVQPPEVKLPDIQDVHIDQAIYLLENWGLKVGRMTYRPGKAKDIVKLAYHNDEQIKPGEPILVGEQIDLIISRGLGNRKVPLVDVTGMPLSEAVGYLKSSRLQFGQVTPMKVDTVPTGMVIRQYPNPTRVDSVLQGYQVDMWVNGTRESIKRMVNELGLNDDGTDESAQ